MAWTKIGWPLRQDSDLRLVWDVIVLDRHVPGLVRIELSRHDAKRIVSALERASELDCDVTTMTGMSHIPVVIRRGCAAPCLVYRP